MVEESLGPYKILEQLGAGGMGEVYLAEDTRLGRNVALKVLPSRFAADPQRLARFEQEARAAAALNHPHIAVVHDVGSETDEDGVATHFIVQEYLEGHSLGTVLDKGALPVDRALGLAAEIGEALTAAHGAGIIHRDLKPDNIFVTESGHAKVLDFGLAKLSEGAAEAVSASMSPTMLGTVAGQVMGTAGYMAPEQIEASGEIDHRADLFSLGCVMYQMVSGQRPFAGKSVPDTLSQVLHHQQAPLVEIDDGLPAELERIIDKCLAKDRTRRYQHADDVIVDVRALRAALEAGSAVSLAELAGARDSRARAGGRAARASGPSFAVVAAVVAITAAVTALGTWWGIGGSQPRPEPVRFHIETGTLDVYGAAPVVAVSPDGRTLVYVSIAGVGSRLVARSLNDFEARELSNTDGAQSPFFSPDGRWVGFFAGNEIRRVPLAGGSAQTITGVRSIFGNADWGSRGNLVFSTWATGTGISEVAAAGGAPREVVPFEPGPSRSGFLNPQVLDNTGRVLFQVQGPGNTLSLFDRDSGETRTLPAAIGPGARYLPTGHLVWAVDGSLFAAPLDLESLALTAPPVSLVEGVFTHQAAAFAVSDSGTLAYVEGTGGGVGGQIVAVDRSGAITRVIEQSAVVARPFLAPDGRSVLAAESGADGSTVFVYDLVRGGRRAVGPASISVWSPDGERIIYRTVDDSPARFASRTVDGSGAPEMLGGDRDDEWWPTDVSPDGRWLAFYEIHPETSRDLWIMDLDDPEFAVQPVLATPASERSAVFSPDGRWLAYVSDASGRDEVYVRPAPPAPGGSFLLSTSGGREPVWARDVSEIFYRRGDQMVSVPLGDGDEFEPGAEEVLFSGNFAVEVGGRNQFYGVTPDNQTFIMVKPNADANRINMVLNWFTELEERVPVGRRLQ